jgi:DNA phosphorothioation-associated putative methyltransferase
VQAERFKALISDLGYGKSLPDAVYILRPEPGEIAPALLLEVQRAEIASRPSLDWNLVKFHKDQTAITFLVYGDFFDDPHPVLAEATKINLKTGTVVQTDYRGRANPPILHRKETFLPTTHPRRDEFAALTRQEEVAGLYQQPTRIGHRQYWQTLLRQKKLKYEGHSLVSVSEPEPSPELGCAAVPVERHRTAIKRYDLSKPVKILLERGLLRKDETFFDFGCGHGMDIQALNSLDYKASGWDPAFRPKAPKTAAAVVNLGYVLNVIEDPKERLATLREAYALSERLLLVSTLVTGQETQSHSRPYGDGFLTKTNTFQKFYSPGELEALIESTLDTEVSTLGLGICVVFRNSDEAELFEASRTRRRIDWGEISAQLQFSSPTSREQRQVNRYELHRELFDGFWQFLLEYGRLPEFGEYERLDEVKNASCGLNRALSLVLGQHGTEVWEIAKRARSEDVLVYLAMTNFRKHFARREIPLRIKNDIRAFFGDLSVAQSRARELLFAAGDPDEIELACDDLKVGWQENDALYVHRTLLDKLPPILRLYVACATIRYGNPEAADLIKLHKRSGKVTFLAYDDWTKLLPELHLRIKVNLRTQFVQVFDHSGSGQCLYFKERFMPADDPQFKRQTKFGEKLRAIGVNADATFGPTNSELAEVLERLGLDANLNKRAR